MNRRQMLRSSAVLAGAAAVKAVGQNSAGGMQPAGKCKIIVTGGHPGDPEYGCGGTIARLTALGHEVMLLYINDRAWQQISAAVRIAERSPKPSFCLAFSSDIVGQEKWCARHSRVPRSHTSVCPN